MSQQGRLVDNASSLETLSGNSGGPVGPDPSGDISIVGTGFLTVSGNPGTYTLTITDNGNVAVTYQADAGTAIAALNILNVLGDATQGSSTSAAGNTITITNSDATTTQKGVLETSTNAESIAGASSTVAVVPSSLSAKLGAQTLNGVAYGTGATTALGYVAALTNGQLVIGSSGVAPVAGAITSTGGTVTVSLGAGTINLETAAAVPTSFATDSGTAVPALGVLTVTGGTLLGTTGAGSTVTINADDNVVGSVVSDSGTATPTGNAFTIAGAGSASTSASGSTVTVTVPGGGITWNVITGTSSGMAVNNGYIGNNAGGVTFTLPVTAAVGSTFSITGLQASWTIAQNAGQTIYLGSSTTTTGVGGSLASTHARDVVSLVCVVANLDFQVISSIGNITVV
jgi:hypothetical protein